MRHPNGGVKSSGTAVPACETTVPSAVARSMGDDEDVRRRSLLLVLLLSACSSAGQARTAQSPSGVLSPVPPPTPSASAPAVVTVAYRVEVRTSDAATRDAAGVVERTLDDPRGWEQAGFELERRADAPFVVVLAEAEEVDRMCRPYDTFAVPVPGPARPGDGAAEHRAGRVPAEPLAAPRRARAGRPPRRAPGAAVRARPRQVTAQPVMAPWAAEPTSLAYLPSTPVV